MNGLRIDLLALLVERAFDQGVVGHGRNSSRSAPARSGNLGDDLLEQLAHLAGHGAELLVFDRGHRRHGIDRRNLDLAAVALLNHDVAGSIVPILSSSVSAS